MRAVRTGLHLTQAEFAALMGVSRRTIIRWEQDTHLPNTYRWDPRRNKFFRLWDKYKEWLDHEQQRDAN